MRRLWPRRTRRQLGGEPRQRRKKQQSSRSVRSRRCSRRTACRVRDRFMRRAPEKADTGCLLRGAPTIAVAVEASVTTFPVTATTVGPMLMATRTARIRG